MVNETGSLVVTQISLLNTFFSGLVAKIVVAVVILLIGFILGKLIGKFTQRLLHELGLNALLKSIANVKLSVEDLVSNFIAYFIYFIALITALNLIGLTTTILYIISAAVIILIVLSIFLGIKDFIPNAMAGIFLYRKRSLNIGDTIKVKQLKGKITKISLVETCVETDRGDTIYIPNSLLTKSEVIKKR